MRGGLVYRAALDGKEDYQIRQGWDFDSQTRACWECWYISRGLIDASAHKRRAFASARTLKEAKAATLRPGQP
jgi:hypothetical protein